MEQPQVLNTLATKRAEIQAYITKLEHDMEQARRDLSAILATEKVFSGEGVVPKAYLNLAKVFPRNEIPRLIWPVLEAATAPISTRDLAAHVIAVKGLDDDDRHLRKALAYKIVQITRRWEKERKLKRVGKVGTAIMWVKAAVCATTSSR
jgi:hypothetical protein